MITGGRNLGRVGTIVNRERHQGSFDICHVKDAQGHTFATRYCFLSVFLFITRKSTSFLSQIFNNINNFVLFKMLLNHLNY